MDFGPHSRYTPLRRPDFEWDDDKDFENVLKHGVPFALAQRAFLDPDRVIVEDRLHSASEERHFCLGKVNGRVMTVRFTHRDGKIRIIGAGFWRKGRLAYEKKNQRH